MPGEKQKYIEDIRQQDAPPATRVSPGTRFSLPGKQLGSEFIFDGAVEIPCSPMGYPMSPVEVSTGVPLPIVGPRGKTPNRHHTFFYEYDYTSSSLGRQAVRLSRIQRVGRYVHEAMFHQIFDGTAFPTSESREWEITILSLAGYVPDLGVKFKQGEARVRELSIKERKRLRRSDIILQDKPSKELGKIGEFLLQYAYEHMRDGIEPLWVEEFLAISGATHKDELWPRKLKLAEKLANRAIDVAVDPVRPVFAQAHRQRKLRNGSPDSAWQVVKNKVAKRIPKEIGLLEERLAAQL